MSYFYDLFFNFVIFYSVNKSTYNYIQKLFKKKIPENLE